MTKLKKIVIEIGLVLKSLLASQIFISIHSYKRVFSVLAAETLCFLCFSRRGLWLPFETIDEQLKQNP